MASLPITCSAEEFCEGNNVWTRARAARQLSRFKKVPVEGEKGFIVELLLSLTITSTFNSNVTRLAREATKLIRLKKNS